MRLLKLGGLFGLSLALVGLVIALPSIAFGDEGRRDFHAEFLGVNETPSISTDATASLRLHIIGSGDTASIRYTLTFSGLSAPVTQAHVHFGQSRVAGGVMFFLCGTTTGTPPTPGPAGTPTCPQSGTVTRTVTAADVVGPGPQGITAGQMDRVIRAIRDGAAYGNVHSGMFTAGETRGQLRPQ
ncbi:MAG TPA: CHRD domain-containing protein [Chloroflexota bacterium]|jgi:hypothetical protein